MSTYVLACDLVRATALNFLVYYTDKKMVCNTMFPPQQPPVARTQLISPLSNPPNGHSQYSPMDHVSYRHQQQQHTNYRGGYSQPAAGQQDLVYMSDEEL